MKTMSIPTDDQQPFIMFTCEPTEAQLADFLVYLTKAQIGFHAILPTAPAQANGMTKTKKTWTARQPLTTVLLRMINKNKGVKIDEIKTHAKRLRYSEASIHPTLSHLRANKLVRGNSERGFSTTAAGAERAAA